MILYKNTKAMVGTPESDGKFFNIIARVLQGDTLAPYMFIICLHILAATSQLLKVMSIYAKQRCGLLLIGYQSLGNLIYPMNKTVVILAN